MNWIQVLLIGSIVALLDSSGKVIARSGQTPDWGPLLAPDDYRLVYMPAAASAPRCSPSAPG